MADRDQVIRNYDRAIEQNPEDASTYNDRGNAYTDREEYERAIRDYVRAIELDPEFADAYHNRGFAYSELGQNERAIRDYNRAIELNPENAMYYRNRAFDLIRTQRYEEATLDCETSEALDPNHPYIHVRWGQLEYARANYEAALASYQKAGTLSTDPTENNLDMALILLHLDRAEEAIEKIQQRLRTYPKPPDLEEMLAHLTELYDQRPELLGVDRGEW